jgi:hypothetical protein
MFRSALVCLGAIAVAFVLKEHFNTPDYWFFLLTPLLAYLINIMAFLTATGKLSLKNFNLQIISLFAVKFFSYLTISIIFFLLESTLNFRIIFISFIFVIYFTNTVILLIEILKYFNSDSKGG